MFAQSFDSFLRSELDGIEDAGLTKSERIILSAQKPELQVASGEVINFCANNYLGLCDHPAVKEAAQKALERYGFGLSSVRFICGTQEIHKKLEASLAHFLRMEDVILYSSCFDANGGLFETLMGPEDAIISDALNHASIIDGVRLSKARRFRYLHSNMQDLRAQLEAAKDCRFKVIATDGVFSMDGDYARLQEICDLADEFSVLVMVDDSHAVGFVGANGRGTVELCGCEGRVDIITGTLGKALGGASGGYVAARKPIVDLLRQRSRPYLFSNTLAPVITAASLKVLELIESQADLRNRVMANAAHFRSAMRAAGFNVPEGTHPIVPVMLGEGRLAAEMADLLLKEGIYVIGFSYPVVPKGQARIRVQLSAAHTTEQIDRAIAAFVKVGRALGVIQA